jgi:hypothetical protein
MMSRNPDPNDTTIRADASLVRISGRHRRATEFIATDRIVLTSLDDGDIELTQADGIPPRALAVLERRGYTFRLVAVSGVQVRINGERREDSVLVSGDVIQLAGGRVLRFRLYPPARPASRQKWSLNPETD